MFRHLSDHVHELPYSTCLKRTARNMAFCGTFSYAASTQMRKLRSQITALGVCVCVYVCCV